MTVASARKLELYRRIANLRELAELRELATELRDRYGTPPEPVRNLLFGVEVKLRALKAVSRSSSSAIGRSVARYPRRRTGATRSPACSANLAA